MMNLVHLILGLKVLKIPVSLEHVSRPAFASNVAEKLKQQLNAKLALKPIEGDNSRDGKHIQTKPVKQSRSPIALSNNRDVSQ